MLSAFGPHYLILSTPEGWVGKYHFTEEELLGVWGSVPAPRAPPPALPSGLGHWDLNPDLPRACLQAVGVGGLPCT